MKDYYYNTPNENNNIEQTLDHMHIMYFNFN